MTWLSKISYAIRALVQRNRVERELDDEIRFHLEKQVEANVAAGMSPEEARYAALRDFGGIEQTKEACRDARGLAFLESLLQDLRFGVRLLLKSRGFTFIAVLTLALAIGANTTMFTFVNTILFKELPVENADRIMGLVRNDPERPELTLPVSYPDFRDWRAQSRTFEDLAAFKEQSMTLSDSSAPPEPFLGALMTADSFSLIGQTPLLGRYFVPNEDRPGVPPVAILSHSVWRSRYGSDPGIVGETIKINGVITTVIGVMPEGMQFPLWHKVWLPLVPTRDWEKRDSRDLFVFGRLTDGVSLADAQAEIDRARNLVELTRLMGTLPTDCFGDGEVMTCDWHSNNQTLGHGTLAASIEVRMRNQVVMRCELPSHGGDRPPGSCRIAVGRRIQGAVPPAG